MPTYEYKIEKHSNTGDNDMQHWLNKMGKEGWFNYFIEPLHNQESRFYFRREVK